MIKIVRNGYLFLLWLWHRGSLRRYFSHIEALSDYAGAKAIDTEVRQSQEKRLAQLFESQPGARFMEVGIGGNANIARHQTMKQHAIRYAGVDFAVVCKRHKDDLRKAGVTLENITFVANNQGTYSWSLMEMVQKDEVSDIIYFDGHHTFYVDLPAAMLCAEILRPGGVIVFDDYLWSMSLLARNMYAHFATWKFYCTMYDFSQYDPRQVEMPHIKLIVDEIFIRKLGYSRLDTSLPGWIMLQAPAGLSAHTV